MMNDEPFRFDEFCDFAYSFYFTIDQTKLTTLTFSPDFNCRSILFMYGGKKDRAVATEPTSSIISR